MPSYDFVCPKCGYKHEIHVKAEWRDTIKLDCPEDGTRLERQVSFPMAVLWEGKFQGRALKKTDYDGAGSEW